MSNSNLFSVVGVYRANGRPTGHTFTEGSEKHCNDFLDDECGDNDLLRHNYALIKGTLEENTYQNKDSNMMYWRN